MEKQAKLGRFYGVGVGPGAPDLLTLRAHRVLTSVPVVLVPQKDRRSDSVAHEIIAGLLKPDQLVVEIEFPMRKEPGDLQPYWQKAADTAWKYLAKGQDCAFINIGDPLLYGTFIYVFRILRRDHPELEIEIVPGISSINAAAACAALPLATGDDKIAIISASSDEAFIRQTAMTFDTVVFLKISSALDRVLAILEPLGLAEKCVFIKRCTTGEEEIIRDITKLRGQKLDYLSLMILRR